MSATPLFGQQPLSQNERENNHRLMMAMRVMRFQTELIESFGWGCDAGNGQSSREAFITACDGLAITLATMRNIAVQAGQGKSK